MHEADLSLSSAFLLQFSAVNDYVLNFLHEVIPDIMGQEGSADAVESSVGELTKSSTFGEAEVGVSSYHHSTHFKTQLGLTR
jgi:hypothetical protein